MIKIISSNNDFLSSKGRAHTILAFTDPPYWSIERAAELPTWINNELALQPKYAIFPITEVGGGLVVIAFDKVKHKPNFDLWFSRVGLPVHGCRPKKPHSCNDTKMATRLDFCRGMPRPVN